MIQLDKPLYLYYFLEHCNKTWEVDWFWQWL